MTFSFRQRPLLAGAVLALAVSFVPLAAQQAPQTERVDLNAVYKIREEGFQRSRVMGIMSWLTDVYGPRLTNSPGFRKAGDWAVKEMTSWGLVNVKLQPFGPFGRGWTNDKFFMMATTPGGSLPVIGYPQAWTSSTNGLVSGEAVFATIDSPEDIATWKGKLKGKFLLSTAMPDVPAVFDPLAQRYTADQLRDLKAGTRRARPRALRRPRPRRIPRRPGCGWLHANTGAVPERRRGSRNHLAEPARLRRHGVRAGRRLTRSRGAGFGASRLDRGRALRPHGTYDARGVPVSSTSRSRTRSTTTRSRSTSSANSPAPTRRTRSSCSARTSIRGTPARAQPTTRRARRS